MKRIKHLILFLLSPAVLVAAVLLFILDNMHINVHPISSFIAKAGQD